MGFVEGLQCKECKKIFPKEPIHVCEYCFGPLEVLYNYDEIKKNISRESIQKGPASMWRYKALLPIDGEPQVGLYTGYTPLVRAKNLEKVLGVKELYIKNDAVNHPTWSFKDRVVACAITKAIEFGYEAVGCASTGNLANSVAAQAAEAGLPSKIFIPDDLEQGKVIGTLMYGPDLVKIRGSYDDVNRLCNEIGTKHHWAFVNINLRPFYGDGSKSYGYEIAEQLGWKTPDHIVVPVAGSSLITKIHRAFKEFEQLGILEDEVKTKVFAAQATGCSPVTTAIKNGWEQHKPQKPNTIAKSIAIGNPADGYYGIKLTRETGGWGEDVSDEEVIKGMKLLAETEGIFTETAGGVTVAVTQKLIEQGKIDKDGSTVICITGNGLKTIDAVVDKFDEIPVIDAKLGAFEELQNNKRKF